MQTLAIKYRPTTFDDVVEQKSIRLILEEQIKTHTHKNCYLFTGGAGTGKTTCARIFAAELNNRKGTPIEIDAASNNGVDNIRDIIDNAKFKALDAPYKVYIIDEVHMLSIGAFNALLKTLEEPPAQTVFILCTTDPQKIPATILSRVQRYDFKRISHNKIVERLEHIMNQERKQFMTSLPDNAAPLDADGARCYEYQPEALAYIATLADGGMRDAISLLDKCLSFSSQVTVANVISALGTINYDELFDLIESLMSGNLKVTIDILNAIYQQGADMRQFVKTFMTFVLDLYKYSLTNSFDYLQIPSTYADDLKQWPDAYFEQLDRYMNSMVKLNADIRWETAPKVLVQSVLLMLAYGHEYA